MRMTATFSLFSTLRQSLLAQSKSGYTTANCARRLVSTTTTTATVSPFTRSYSRPPAQQQLRLHHCSVSMLPRIPFSEDFFFRQVRVHHVRCKTIFHD